MIDLIERLGSAKEGSRELDADIGEYVGAKPKTKNVYKRGRYVDGKPVLMRVEKVWPHYTTSLDAALTLVPEGWLVNRFWQDEDGWEVMLTETGTDEGMGTPNFVEAALMFDGNGIPTPALALCIASLKARGTQDV